ncbi:MAG: RNA methyltransferase [Bacteriovorax sp.]|nr:RNA methyltransferase [Bacteriovorax sp.]
MIEITSFDDPRIIEFSKMRDHTLNDQGFILAESEKLFLQLRASNKTFLKILSTPDFAKRYHLQGDNIYIASKNILEQIAGFKIHFEVIFLAEKPLDYDIDKLDDRIILLNGLSSPENVGSIVRSAAAFNINSIIVDEKTCSPFLRRCIRVSMGNIFSMKSFHSSNIRNDLENLKSLGYTIISTANIPHSQNLTHYDFPKKSVLIIGSEGHGIDHDIIGLSDVVLKIIINSQVAHLNASNAAAIFLSHMSLVK